jgi:hypothetical protein
VVFGIVSGSCFKVGDGSGHTPSDEEPIDWEAFFVWQALSLMFMREA